MLRQRILTLTILFTSLVASATAQRYDRGFERNPSTFIEKGTWMVGGTVAYSTHRNDNYRFIIVDDINSNGYRLAFSPVFCYMVRDNMGVGMRFSYGRNLLKVDSASVSFDEININVKDYYSLSHDYSMIAIYRNYIPLGDSKRFALYNEVQFSLGGGQAKLIDGHGASIIGTYEKTKLASIGLSPGMIAFVNDRLAVELNVGMLGLKYAQTDQIHNQVATGSRRASQINFKVNILAIGFGMAYYL
ncbi:MAG: hypothetical protein MR292_09470 [Alistipes sp.]|nr:hypothetical protein [Alistipes sp.]